MTTAKNPNTVEIGGHRCNDTGMREGIGGSAVTLWRCNDCGVTATWSSFDVGTRGCPARPESLDYLSVCPGGQLCEGHPDTSTPEWRMWKESKSMPKDQVPQIRCDGALVGVRAAREWISFADKIGMKTSAWAQSSAQYVHEGGGVVAELTANGDFHIIVTRRGKLAAHRGGGYGCAACNRLKETGDLPS